MINKEYILNILTSNKLELFEKYPLSSLCLFGSFARNDFREESDIDILVDFNAPVGIRFIDLADELENILHRKVDLVSKGGIRPKYFNEIKKDLIYV